MAENQDEINVLFSVLGLAPGSTANEVKKAFRKMAKKMHPDKCNSSDATERFKELNNAYAELLKHLKENSDKKKLSDLDSMMVHIKVKKCTYCVVVNVGMENIKHFLSACCEQYGTPRDQGIHGMKFSQPYRTTGDDNHNLGTIHVTVYLSTANVMVQGPSYLLWHAETLPQLVEKMTAIAKKLCIDNADEDSAVRVEKGTNDDKDDQDKNAKRRSHRHHKSLGSVSTTVSSCSICDAHDTKDMIMCDACGTWQHFACSKLFPEIALREATKEEAVYLCWKCEADVSGQSLQMLPVNDSDTQLSTMNSLIQSLERNIIETMNLMTTDANRTLEEKHHLEKELMKERYRNEIGALSNKVKTLEKKCRELESRIPDEEQEVTADPGVDVNRISQLQNELQNTEERNGYLSEHNRTLQSQNKQLEERIKEMSKRLLQYQSDNEKMVRKINDAEEANKNILEQNQKLNEELWTMKRQKADQRVTVVSRNVTDIQTNLDDGEPPSDENDRPNQTHEMVMTEEEPPPRSETSLEDQMAENNTNQDTDVQQNRKIRRGGHIIITSSIGKDIDGDRLAPQASNRVVMKSLSGAMVKDIKGFVERTPFQHKSVTILVGGNDLSNGKTVSECCLEYESLVQCIRRNNPNAHINLVEIPPRINQKTVTNNIYDMNQWIHDWANKEENADCTFIRNGLDENPYLYQQDQVHLSRNRGGGVSRLAMSLRSCILASEQGQGYGPEHPHGPPRLRGATRWSGPRQNQGRGQNGFQRRGRNYVGQWRGAPHQNQYRWGQTEQNFEGVIKNFMHKLLEQTGRWN